MLVTRNFVFIHIPKTAGTFCKKTIEAVAGPVLYEGAFHAPLSRLPVQFGNLPVIAFVRNPWDWYVSWYFHMMATGAFNPLIGSAVAAGKREFAPVMLHVFDSLEVGTPEYQMLSDYLNSQAHKGKEAHDLNSGMVDTMRRKGCGMLSWRYFFNVGERDGLHGNIGKYENLGEDLISLMERCGTKISVEQRQGILGGPAINASATRQGRDFRKFYDDALVERVAEREKFIVENFGYAFG